MSVMLLKLVGTCLIGTKFSISIQQGCRLGANSLCSWRPLAPIVNMGLVVGSYETAGAASEEYWFQIYIQ
eukprot:SAG31_NODE_1660_length_7599_cov_3.194800_3_plen_70_part_00